MCTSKPLLSGLIELSCQIRYISAAAGGGGQTNRPNGPRLIMCNEWEPWLISMHESDNQLVRLSNTMNNPDSIQLNCELVPHEFRSGILAMSQHARPIR
jgi:hypothetical protein